ncbi:hypothetical protein [Clostridium ganghwense]|uniref:Uncharacterized protein n=1 Tax=Clostridium ganghwense TaxID=312089 RepID=A0ABT4CME0_9CLOT|nr:hypothetical protein [Clostridium ganghwense]MCY6370217.1 hypothetical protein [Clostridium ganghwense]
MNISFWKGCRNKKDGKLLIIENIKFTGKGTAVLKPYPEKELHNIVYLNRPQKPWDLFKQSVKIWKNIG